MRRWLGLAKALDGFNGFLGAATAWLALAMVGIGAFNACARYLGRHVGKDLSSNAYIELQWYLFSLLFLIGGAATLLRNRHVRVDVIQARLSRRARAWIDLLGTFLFLVPFCVVALIVSWPSVRNSWRVLEVSPDPGGLPRYPIKAAILVAFALLILQGISEAVKRIAEIRGEGAGNADARVHGEGV